MKKIFINTRIKELRKVLKLNQAEFGDTIGLKTSAISKMEQEGSTVTEQNITLICEKFNVRREWLVDGEGEMQASADASLFSSFAKRYNLDDAEQNAIRYFLGLPENERRDMLRHVTELADAICSGPAADGIDIDKETTNYRDELMAMQEAPGKLSASATTAATKRA